MPSVAETLAQAKALHAAGDLSTAELLYRRALEGDPASSETLYLLGEACQALGKLSEAESTLRRAVQIDPEYPEALNALGAVLGRQGKLTEAAACAGQALLLKPDYAEAYCNLAAVAACQNKFDEAAACWRRAVELKPEMAEVHANLATAAMRQNQLDEAAACWRRASELKPDIAETHANLGAVLAKLEKLEEAAASYRRALELKPGHAEVHNNLGAVLSKQGRFDEAEACWRRAVSHKPDFAEAHNNLGTVLEKQRRLDEAAAYYRRAAELKPDFAEAHHNLGAVLAEQSKLDEASLCCRRALQLKPNYAEAHGALGAILARLGEAADAMAHYRRAIELKPDLAAAQYNLGALLAQQNNLDEAVACFQKAVAARPDYAQAHSSMLQTLQHQRGADLARLAAAHREFEERHAAIFRRAWTPHHNQPIPERRLRLGFVSADLGFHPVGYFTVRVLENLDRRQTETICYSDRQSCDAMTLRLRAAATAWRDINALDDQQLADQIRADGIDILFDLAGHTPNNRLLAFARKPAPVQITWMGYVGTTGLRAMDYLLADRYHVPQTAEPHVVEQVLRMPDGYVCYDPPSYAPGVSPPPALERGFVTFGSFNNPAKVTPQVVDTWASILRRVSGARLVLKYPGLEVPPLSRSFVEMFASHDIDSSRFELLGRSSHLDLLRQYQGIDIALDPFPYSGGLTTCEALWMGVPVVTCPGETFAGRHSLSHLSNVGLTETIATDLQDYAEIAAGLAADLPLLAGMRARLRAQMAESPLCDGKRFSDNLLALCRDVWRRWCATRPAQESGLTMRE